jgi:response regulator of citrate/malate metabolism
MSPTLSCFIIEDDLEVSSLFCSLVGRKSIFDIEEIMNGRTALELLSDLNVDLVILDLYLPEVSGIQLLDFIRTQAHLAHTSIIVVTGDYEMARLVEDQVQYVLFKPVSIPQLDKVLDQVAYQHAFIPR